MTKMMMMMTGRGRLYGVLARSIGLVGVALIAAGWPTASAATPSATIRSAEWWIGRWGLEDAWPITKGAGVVVAVLDSGVDGSLSYLRGAVLQGADYATGKTDGSVDFDSGSHGTRMAVLVAGRPRDAESMTGVAPSASILPVAIGTAEGVPDAAGIRSAHAIRWAVDHGATVINMSYAAEDVGGCPSDLQAAVLFAIEHDVILIAGAGNSGTGTNLPAVPALCPGVVAVGAVDRDGRPWVGSERQGYVDLAAPGVDIVSIDKNGRPRHATGTSDAAALVSGVVALVRARFPGMSGREVVGRLLATAKDAGAPGKDDQTGYGIVRPLNALTADVPAGVANPVYEEVDRIRVAAGVAGHSGTAVARNWPVVGALGGAVAAVVVVLGILVARRRRVRGR